MPDRRNIMTNYIPVFLGFSLSLVAMIGGSYIVTRDATLENKHAIENNEIYKTRFDEHVLKYEQLDNRVVMIERDMVNSTAVTNEFKDLLRRNEATLRLVNLTLTETTTITKKDIEQINKRLDNAGL